MVKPVLDRFIYKVTSNLRCLLKYEMVTTSTGDAEVDAKVTEWLTWDKNEQTRQEIEALVAEGNVKELRKRLCSRMEFGTAGLRAAMGAGYAMMNDLTIIQTTQGIAKYMLTRTPDVKQKGVIIGYDARYNSKRFAWLTATVLINLNIPVHLYSQICPTPFVPYGVLKLKCSWGIMITASHNPKQDNGYKVYFENGAQIIPPHDRNIAQSIENNLEPWPSSWDTNVVDNSTLRSDPFKQIMSDYMQDIKQLCYHRDDNNNSTVTFTYTAMHGVGYQFIVEAFKQFGFKPCLPVEKQVEPDPEFPTVKFPNPEEGRSALDLAIETADQNNSTVILANDPDADRLALAEKLPSGSWYVFSGNEMGGLLGWWFMSQYPTIHPRLSASECYCLASSVSSRILKTIATKQGFNFVETLTGFKWMGNKAVELMKEGKHVFFAFEEAIGFMCGTTVLDKDGISAAMVMAEMVAQLAKQGITVKQQLENIYAKFGYHVSNNSYFICHDGEITKRIFDRLRNFGGPNKYPTSCGPYAIKYIRDLTTGYDNSQPDCKAVLPVSKGSQMITFTFENGCIATMRTSGTEPKIKYYTEFCADPAKQQDRDAVVKELKKVVDSLIEHFFEPEKNKLIYRSS